MSILMVGAIVGPKREQALPVYRDNDKAVFFLENGNGFASEDELAACLSPGWTYLRIEQTSVDRTCGSEELEALGEMLEIAFEDRRLYLRDGSPTGDHDDNEWPTAATIQARRFRQIATLTAGLQMKDEAQRWNALADNYDASAKSQGAG